MIPAEIYKSRVQYFEKRRQAYHSIFNRLSWLRVGLFLGGLGTGYIFYHSYGIGLALLVIVLFLIAFSLSLKRHLKVKYQRDHSQFLSHINYDESERLENRLIREDTGEQYQHTEHAYSGDLDIFGKHSIYRLLNRTYTEAGGRKLAQWLSQPTPADEIRRRHEAVKELVSQLEWRQELQASAMHYPSVGTKPENLLLWMEDPTVARHIFLMRLARFLPILTIPLVLAWLFDLVSLQILFPMILVHLLILGKIFERVKRTCDQTNKLTQTVTAYADIIRVTEMNTFHSPLLKHLQQTFQVSGQSASQAIAQLANLLRNLNYRNNPYFYLLVGVVSLWDLQYFIRLENWKDQYRQALPHWIETLGDWEALNSLASFSFSNPSYSWPDISEEPFELKAEGLGHVLIRADKRVSNEISFLGLGKTLVITGSNMSGKSTFLRTVGVNIVLALAGAPVCARVFKVSVIQVFTGMRTQDSLEESVSSFYAELKRLKQLIQLVEQGKPTLYFLDEILKGTNSLDRHNGAKALIKQLHRYTASGFISTHDLELGKMAEEHRDYVQNYSFNSAIIDGKLSFDYKLREGVCHSFNASELMRQIGIEL